MPVKSITPAVRLDPKLATGRLGNGEVQRAIVKVLTAAQKPMRPVAIQRSAEQLLGREVSMHSIYWCLSTGARAKKPRFVRVAYSEYFCVQ